jgi:hypothetical protein
MIVNGFIRSIREHGSLLFLDINIYNSTHTMKIVSRDSVWKPKLDSFLSAEVVPERKEN